MNLTTIDMERQVLGWLMKDPDRIDEIPYLKAEDFSSKEYAKIYKKIIEMDRPDLALLGREMNNRALLVGMVEETFGLCRIGDYAKIIKESSDKCKVKLVCQEIIELADIEDSSSIIDIATEKLFSITNEQLSESRILKEYMPCSLEKMDAAARGERGILTGIHQLDEILWGLEKGNLYIIGGRPGTGKTQLGLQFATYIAKNHCPVEFISIEMTGEQICTRIICFEAGVNSDNARRGRLDEGDWNKIVISDKDTAKIPLYICDKSYVSTSDFRSISRRAVARDNVGLIIVDYLQLMHGSGKFENRHTEVSHISSVLKATAKELDVPVIGLAQLNRLSTNRTDATPQLSDLKESGSIEQDADVVIFVHKNEIIIAKHRNGPTGRINMTFLNGKWGNLDWRLQ